MKCSLILKIVKNILNIFVPCCTGLGRGDTEFREERENTIETGKRSFSLCRQGIYTLYIQR